ncbi:MAG: nuclear transport factor 2 family protein [Actinobacteria bacterium]|nr:nuclear transport factor 2 family protein [Actinomycetota bacterium]
MDAEQLGRLTDRQQIADLLSRYCLIPDRGQYETATDVFTEDVVAVYPHATIDGREALVESGRGFFGRFERLQHVTANELVEVDGDTGTVRANLIATHVLDASRPDVFFRVGGIYEFDLVRTVSGWRISRLEQRQVWTEGTPAG